jgi:hypothetical protein
MLQKVLAPAVKAPSKDTLLQKADGLRGLARRARRAAQNTDDEADRRHLEQYVEELEQSASRLEKAAIDAKSG